MVEKYQKMLHIIIFVIYIYVFFKSGKGFNDDFQLIMNDQDVNEEESCKFQMLIHKLQFSGSFGIGATNMLRCYVESDQKMKLSYCPLALSLLLVLQSHQLYSFYNVKSVID